MGLDLGPNSIGWSLIQLTENKPSAVIDSGVRVFAAGLNDLETTGKGESPNVQRRMARQVRRGIERTARRMQKLALLLQRFGLLPEGDLKSSQSRHLIFNDLDARLDFPFTLRAKALDQRLEPYALGRVLYHLAQKRGFLSNRKSGTKKDDESGAVKKGISELDKAIKESGCRTLGEYFAGLDPRQQRFRGRYTGRQMRIDEFDLIWFKQNQFHPIMTDELRKRIYDAIFHQRPLKSQAHLIGECELEKGRKRAPWALMAAQRFRYLQRVNDLKVIDVTTGEVRELNATERVAIIGALEVSEEVTFAKMRRLGPSLQRATFNLEEGGEKKLPGNKTAGRLRKIFDADRWDAMSRLEQDAVVEDWRSTVTDASLLKRGKNRWGLSDEQAMRFSELSLESGYCSFSRQALAKLLPCLEKGMPLQTAIEKEYPDRATKGEPLDSLPSLESDLVPDIRNPIVSRTLCELRTVVNSLIKKYGKPEIIRIELARDLRQTSRQRMETIKRNRANEMQRQEAAKKILSETGIENPSRNDILRVLLAAECDWICPYTGKSIGMSALVGDQPEFDIEHILPFDRSLDDSFANKTLCYAEENRNVKKNRTPYEAYHTSPQGEEILSRVSKFQGRLAREKLRRFRMTPEEVELEISEFTARQLNDTRWASKWAKRYLGLLYGGADANGVDAFGKLRVQATSGTVTAFLRRAWGLNDILTESDTKSRDDHRHHAVDATVIALTDAGAVKSLNDAARRASVKRESRKFEDAAVPYEGFRSQVVEKIENIAVSHRVSHRVRGPLHTGTYYGTPRLDDKGRQYVTVRKALEGLTPNDVAAIVDPKVKEIVKSILDKTGEPPKKVFADMNSHPTIPSRTGKPVPIHSVRVRDNLTIFKVGSGERTRNVISDTNHHMELVALLDEKGAVVKWEGYVVSMFEAYERKRNNQPVICRDHRAGKQFLFSLAGGDTIELDTEGGTRSIFVVRTVPKSLQIRFVGIADARKLADIRKSGMTAYPETLRIGNCRKVVVTPLGEVRYAND